MSDTSWVTIFASLVSGGVLVKATDYLHDAYRRRRERIDTARDLLARHLDPILKAADELAGQVRSLAVTDFADFRDTGRRGRPADVVDLRRSGAVFYFVQFWARVQLLKIESGSIALAADTPGGRLQLLIQQLEARAVRIVDRTWQRAAGEAILLPEKEARRPMNLYEFSSRYKVDADFRVWSSPLASLLEESGTNQKSRQKLLKYGVVVHALIDTLDPKHIVTTDRDPWPNKLSDSTRKQLAFGTFRAHLPFVSKAARYTQIKKKGGPSGR